jgi:type 1 glutamine amidotransferase
MKHHLVIWLFIAALSGLAIEPAAAAARMRVLILSGSNNHAWRETTPAIKEALEETGRFEVDVEENVASLKADSFAPYAVILSNFNTFGGDAAAPVWDATTKQGFMAHLAQGHGLVIVHAGSSVFYDWPEFQQLACGSWQAGTHHDAIHVAQVRFTGEVSPITAGLQPFWIRDEFWQNTGVSPGAKALATVDEGSGPKDPAVNRNIMFTTEVGGARGFALFLGHDAAAMHNPAWQTLLQRGTEWAATGKVTLPVAKTWPATQADADTPAWSWQQTNTSLSLCNGDKTVWRLVVDATQPKTYFHPLATTDGQVLTGFEPADHPWHRGLWWSWKLINGVNYWEEDPRTHASAGVTELTRATVKPGGDFTAHAELCFSYHPPDKPAVMTEVRTLTIGRPDADGRYRIDWTSEFTAGGAPVMLERTAPLHQGGVAYGGYAGLSLRFPPGLKGWNFRTSEGHNSAATGNGQPARWTDLSGPDAGIAVFDHPGNLRHPSPWYLYDSPPLLYFSPAILFNEPLELAAQQTLHLTYRVLVHSKPITAEQLEHDWSDFVTPAKH